METVPFDSKLTSLLFSCPSVNINLISNSFNKQIRSRGRERIHNINVVIFALYFKKYLFQVTLDVPLRPQKPKHKASRAYCYNCSGRNHYGHVRIYWDKTIFFFTLSTSFDHSSINIRSAPRGGSSVELLRQCPMFAIMTPLWMSLSITPGCTESKVRMSSFTYRIAFYYIVLHFDGRKFFKGNDAFFSPTLVLILAYTTAVTWQVCNSWT